MLSILSIAETPPAAARMVVCIIMGLSAVAVDSKQTECGDTTVIPYSEVLPLLDFSEFHVLSRCPHTDGEIAYRLLVAAAGADEACWMTTDLEVPFMLHHQSSGSQDNFAAHEYMEDLAMGQMRLGLT
ncbi:TPA: hypothetical protein ACH3X2_004057 [Trebouxia sp. C0005]